MNKKQLYENIMASIAKEVKKALNENINISTLVEKRADEDVINEIITNIKKYFKEHISDKTCELDLHYNLVGFGERPWGMGWQERLRDGSCAILNSIKVCNKEYLYDSFYKIKKIAKAIEQVLKADSTNVFIFNYDNVDTISGTSRSLSDDILSSIEIIHPCKEFELIQKYLIKYANYNLKLTDCYIADLFGKRGVLDEELHKKYIALLDKRCAKFLEALKASKTTRDLLFIEKYKAEDHDDLNYSREYETECYGSKIVSIKAIIKSPIGRIKNEIIL